MNICGHLTKGKQPCTKPVGDAGWCGTPGHSHRRQIGKNASELAAAGNEASTAAAMQALADSDASDVKIEAEIEVLRCQAQDVVIGEFAEEWRPCEGMPDGLAESVGKMGQVLRSAAHEHSGDPDAPIRDMSEFLSGARSHRGVISLAYLSDIWPQEFEAVEAWSQDWKENVTPNEIMEMGDSVEMVINHAKTAAEHSDLMREWWCDHDACDVGRTEREKAFRTKMLGHDTLAASMHPVETGDDRFAQRVRWIIDASVEDIDESDGERHPIQPPLSLWGLLVRGCERVEDGEQDPVMREAVVAALNWQADWPKNATANDLRRLGTLIGDIGKHKQPNDFMVGTLRRRLEADGVPRERWHPVLLG